MSAGIAAALETRRRCRKETYWLREEHSTFAYKVEEGMLRYRYGDKVGGGEENIRVDLGKRISNGWIVN